MDTALNVIAVLVSIVVAMHFTSRPIAQTVTEQFGRFLLGVTVPIVWLAADFVQFACWLDELGDCTVNGSVQREASQDAKPTPLKSRHGMGAERCYTTLVRA